MCHINKFQNPAKHVKLGNNVLYFRMSHHVPYNKIGKIHQRLHKFQNNVLQFRMSHYVHIGKFQNTPTHVKLLNNVLHFRMSKHVPDYKISKSLNAPLKLGNNV